MTRATDIADAELTVALKAAETEIGNLNLGVSAFITLDRTDEESDELCYHMDDGVWGLYVLASDQRNDLTPIDRATQAQRIKAAHVLSDLLDILRGNADREILPVTQATTVALAFVEKMNQKTDPSSKASVTASKKPPEPVARKSGKSRVIGEGISRGRWASRKP